MYEGYDGAPEESVDTVWRDVILLALAGFVALVILLLPHLNPPEVNAEVTSPGSVIVEIRWPDGWNTDVDLWVQAPGDVPVGYSNKSGAVFNLLRDDVGTNQDITGFNYENSYSRGVPNGEYTVNLHLFGNLDNRYPVPVQVTISVKVTAQQRPIVIGQKTVELHAKGQELTVFRFSLDDRGSFIAGSMHDTPRKLREARSP